MLSISRWNWNWNEDLCAHFGANDVVATITKMNVFDKP